MKKISALAFFLFLTGCACSQKDKTDLYRAALTDTNASLTQCRDENMALHRVVERDHKLLTAYKKRRS